MSTWKEAFLQQARSDFMVLLHLKQTTLDYCHFLHYLQMASEKLAKSHLCHGTNPPKFVHDALVKFIRVESIAGKLRWSYPGFSAAQYRETMKDLLPLAQKIEALAPEKNVSCPNPEYPWIFPGSSATEVIAPAQYHFPHFDKKNFQMIRFFEFLKKQLNT